MKNAVNKKWDKFTTWTTLHIIIPVSALHLAYHTMKEEIQTSD